MSRGLFVSGALPAGRARQPSSRRSIAERAGFVWLMPPEEDSPPAVVLGPSSRCATPGMRVCTSSPVPAGTDLLRAFAVVDLREVAFFEGFADLAAFFFVPFEAAFFVVGFAFRVVAFFALPFGFALALAFAAFFAFFVVVLAFLLAAFERLPDFRAAMSCPPS